MATRSRKTSASASKAKTPAKTHRNFHRKTVKIDPIDLRDRHYMPSVHARPPAQLIPTRKIPVLNQKDTSACTGFALATVLHWLQCADDRRFERVSPFMIYSMARRYDEFPGSVADDGSSVRGALKGWSRHGICREELWKTLKMPPVPAEPEDDWWSDAMRRPLGAYYRVKTDAIADMHVALHDGCALFVSAVCHAGWDEGTGATAPKGEIWKIPFQEAAPSDGGHAFVILGYTHDGFIIQNSWGTDWGTDGRAILRYEDWQAHAMDCWVVQLGVPTSLHLTLAESSSLRMRGSKVQLAQDVKLRNHEIAPYIVNMENNGKLSTSGDFRTSAGDVEALVSTYLQRARDTWKLGPDDAADIVIYAHGGLTSEKDAAATAARWIPRLYEQRIFPIFLMWETGMMSTLSNIVREWFGDEPKKTTGITRWWNERLERTLAKPGTEIWGEMKENGELISTASGGGGQTLYKAAVASAAFRQNRDRLHLVGHSAGSIVHCHLADMLANKGWKFSSVNFMAPAATVELFEEKLRPHLKKGNVERYNQWHLSDPLESNDSTCRPILGYGRSLLYLVSESFEGGNRTPLIGMQKYFHAIPELPRSTVYASQSSNTNAATHGGFDDDEATLASVIKQIKAAR